MTSTAPASTMLSLTIMLSTASILTSGSPITAEEPQLQLQQLQQVRPDLHGDYASYEDLSGKANCATILGNPA